MRNLYAGLESVRQLELGSEPNAAEDESVQAFCLGNSSDGGRVYCATSAAAVVCVSQQDGKVGSRCMELEGIP
jgi:hypothetical protein